LAQSSDFQPSQIKLVRKRTLAELHIAPPRIVDALSLTKARRGLAPHGFIKTPFDFMLNGVGQLGTAGRKELDPVILKGIVGRGDHHPCLQTQRTGQISDRGRWQRPGQINVHSGCRESSLESRLKHVSRNSGVLANDHGGMLPRPHTLIGDQCLSGCIA